MKLKSHHWMLSALLALAAHSALFIALLITYETHGAKAEGENGIELNLGMLGDAGVATITASSVVKPPTPVKEDLDVHVDKTATRVRKIEKVIAKQAPEIILEKKAEESPVADTKTTTAVIDEITSQPNKTGDIDVTKDTQDVTKDTQEAYPHEQPSTELKTDVETTNETSQLSKTTGSAKDSSAGGPAGYHQDYLAKLVAQLTEHKHYPRLSRKRAEEGITVLSFNISRTGKVLHYHIEKSSGFNALDKAVLAMLKNAQPFEPLPTEIQGEQISLTLPIAFQMDRS